MLLNLHQYYRPSDDGSQDGLARALELLARPDVRTVPLAGGDTLIGAGDRTVEAVVDLQSLGLDSYSLDPNLGALSAKAMVTRAQLAGLEAAAPPAPGPASHAAKDTPLRILAAGARRWGGSMQRNRATLGGALATAAANDPLVVALLACDARVLLCAQAGYRTMPLAEFLPERQQILAAPALITDVVVPLPPGRLTGYGLADVARTPADAPIVVAAAAITVSYGICAHARLALGGAAPDPLRLPEVEAQLVDQALTPELIAAAAARAAECVQPAGDFRGSAEYRKAMVGVLAKRALQQAWQGAIA
jgi:carbon-monoxide dehydrogenase medium subunit